MAPAGKIRLTGLWTSEGPGSWVQYSGRINNSCRLVVVPNRHKRRESDPDFIAYLVPMRGEERSEASVEKAEEEEDDIPF